MIFILSGLNPDASEDGIARGLAPYFSVTRVQMIRDGDVNEPWALVEVRDSYQKVWQVTNRLRGIFHRGKALQFYIPIHQPPGHVWPDGDAGLAIHLD